MSDMAQQSLTVGDRIGQLVIVQNPQIEFVESDELSETKKRVRRLRKHREVGLAKMKIIIDNQSLLDFGQMMGVVFSLMNDEGEFISQNKNRLPFH